MRAAKTKHLWRSSQACRGNPTSCLRREVMRVIGDRVQREMSDSRSGLANSQKGLHRCEINFPINGRSVPLSRTQTHTHTVKLKLLTNKADSKDWQQHKTRKNPTKPKGINELCLCGRRYPFLVWFVYNIWKLCSNNCSHVSKGELFLKSSLKSNLCKCCYSLHLLYL